MTKTRFLYICDRDKNKICSHTACSLKEFKVRGIPVLIQKCNHTKYRQYSRNWNDTRVKVDLTNFERHEWNDEIVYVEKEAPGI